MLCDGLDGGLGDGVGGRSKRGGVYVYLELTHSVGQQKLTHCKAIIFQLKKEK